MGVCGCKCKGSAPSLVPNRNVRKPGGGFGRYMRCTCRCHLLPSPGAPKAPVLSKTGEAWCSHRADDWVHYGQALPAFEQEHTALAHQLRSAGIPTTVCVCTSVVIPAWVQIVWMCWIDDIPEGFARQVALLKALAGSEQDRERLVSYDTLVSRGDFEGDSKVNEFLHVYLTRHLRGESI